MLFEQYLLRNQLLNDSKTLLHSYSDANKLSSSQNDSLNYYFGKTYYQLENFDSSKYFFAKVSTYSYLYTESCLTKSYISMSTGDTNNLQQDIEKIHCYDKKSEEFLNFTKASVYVMERDTINFNKCKRFFSNDYPDLSESEKKLISIKNNLPYYHKSGFIAGTLSAIIPGLGKIYAGKPKQGLVSFLPIVFLGLQTYEVYINKNGGIKSPWFIANAGLFAVFYIGNIWGSALSVSVKRNELYHEVNDQILLNLHIPLQKFYN